MSVKTNDTRQTPLTNISESPELLPRRTEHRSPRKQRKPAKPSKEELRYQRFVKDLKRDIQFHLKQSLRESRFDIRTHPANQFSWSTKPPNRTLPSLETHRSTDREAIVTAINKREDPALRLKHTSEKRLEADVQTILTSPAMKLFYYQFIRPLPKRVSSSKEHDEVIPFVESLLNVS